MKPKLATEIRGAYKELNNILQEGTSDAEKNKAIQKFAQEIATQIKEGFSAGFKSNEKDNKENPDAIFLKAKKNIEIKNIKYIEPKWSGNENIIYSIKNNSNQNIGSIKLNFEYYKNGELIDCENKWISEIKILEPNQEIALSVSRKLPKKETEEEQEQYKSDEIKIIVTGFDIKKIN